MSLQDPFRSSPVLAAPVCGDARSKRLVLAASAAVHVLLLAGALALPARLARRSEPPERLDLVLYRPPTVQPEAVAPPPPAPAPPEPKPVAIAKAKPVAPPPPVPVPPRPDPEPPAPAIARSAPPPAPPVEPEPAPVARRAEPPRPVVRTQVFGEAQSGSAPVAATARVEARTGTFGRDAAAAAPRPLGPRSVAAAGFAAPVAAAPATGSERGSVMPASFDLVSAPAEPRPPSRGAGSVKRGGFGDGGGGGAPQAPRPPQRPGERPDTPVEIVSKPTPRYTDEARRLRVEGEVILEVTFVASGQLRVLRVVEGLGHGLDEAAVEAAGKVRFTPARRNGQPVDHTATLRVVFQLT
jgi:TonB family protein